MIVTPRKNPRKNNGDLGNISCDKCGCSSGAYIELMTSVYHRPYEAHKTVVCKGCLLDWADLINKTILKEKE